MQEAPDSLEDLAKIPRLGLADLPGENAAIPQRREQAHGATLSLHDLPTSGIVYLDLGLDLSAVPDRLLPLVPILGRALLEMGTQKTGFVDLTRRIATTTGGLWGQAFLSSVRSEDGSPSGGCALTPPRACSCAARPPRPTCPPCWTSSPRCWSRPTLAATLESGERLAKILLESKAREEQRPIPAGTPGGLAPEGPHRPGPGHGRRHARRVRLPVAARTGRPRAGQARKNLC